MALCGTESTLDNIAAAEIRHGTFSENDNVKDYTECIARKLGYIKDDGVFDLEYLRSNYGSRFGHDRVNGFLNECYRPGETTKHTAYNLIKCQYIYDHEHFSN